MDKTSPMKSKPLVDVTCKLGTKGCFEDGRCHALGNCENKIVTNADRIRAMTDEELALFLTERYAKESILRVREEGHEPTATQIKALHERLHLTWMRWLRQYAEVE
jgi:hypothetical protein